MLSTVVLILTYLTASSLEHHFSPINLSLLVNLPQLAAYTIFTGETG